MKENLTEYENLTYDQKLNIIRNLFRHTEGDILNMYIDFADIRVQSGEAKSFWEAGLQLQKEYRDFKKSSPKPKKNEHFGEEQAEGLREMMAEIKKEERKKINEDIKQVFKDMDEDVKKDKHNSKTPLKITKIISEPDR
ncbi:MAG: hypothetical protein IKP65_00830 [Alphaproteobacteria bacterium]|nr:hypothetical protein [Alphaproteobacteria bacterium]